MKHLVRHFCRAFALADRSRSGIPAFVRLRTSARGPTCARLRLAARAFGACARRPTWVGLLAGCALALLGTFPALAETPSSADPLGRWVTSSGNLEVEVAPCGDALCGTVVRVLANRSMSRDGEEMKAADSRDPMGMQVLTGFVPSEYAEASGARVPVEWRGEIYNRENAKTYACIMTIGAQGELLLHGYVGIPWFGRTSAWTRPAVAVGGAH